ncbi:MAG: 2-C-methyl-D-erythritol 2,4-cyclodiphosphate synthase [Clostridiales bacterium]|nr:2-C-methyl-D-erythritol 2,4-cyclodiphosphate synthase [Clostridiales bacterium]
MRIGHGYDAHRFTEGDALVLGGVKIPYEKAFLAHSDGDVLIHALIDALFGAAGEGDIGAHYPPSDEQYRGISSTILLRDTAEILADLGLTVEYADMTIIAQRPKMAPYLGAMRERIAQVLGVPLSRINVKATTEEKMGFTGRGEGIAAHAVCLLNETDQNG